jgi:hypothetical protein
MKINLNELKDNNIILVEKIKNSSFTNGHKYKQCYLEADKQIPTHWICNLPCDLYCPNRIKI